jgi:hypothetical protein
MNFSPSFTWNERKQRNLMCFGKRSPANPLIAFIGNRTVVDGDGFLWLYQFEGCIIWSMMGQFFEAPKRKNPKESRFNKWEKELKSLKK